ncbi:uncharacterized protein LOC126796214 isoform X2 [Argentina anserina]|uniref:uncharacterized protein LOC126796214 isoform X2 n=1 Tax=Argentina anserina TaxID=57926 RepID=UPI00217623E1|nr:uncharacterized protein LOC126796214 isoform X2 [Potentilla anserina]
MAAVGEYLVEEILLTLPPKALMRFKCASKGWYALINNPSVANIKIPLSMSLLTRDEAVHMVAHCNGIICLLLSKKFQVILWNPAIQEFKLLPPSPYLHDLDVSDSDDFYPKYIQGFGYDAKLNEHKFVNIALSCASEVRGDGYNIHNRPKAAIYSLSTDSWKKINTNALETETTVFRPESFQIQFKEMFYWLGHERHKELDILDSEDLIIRQVIILLDIQNEVFYDIMLPDCFYKPWVITSCMTLRVWNESLALFVLVDEQLEGLRAEVECSFVVWVMDELGGPTGASWTKHVTLEPTEKPLGFLNSNDIFLGDFMGLVCSYDLGSKRIEEEIFRQNLPYTVFLSDYYSSDDIAAVAYVKSIVTVMEAHNKLDIRDNSSVANLSPLPYFPLSPSIADREWHSYSIWVIPPYDVSLRIKKVMEGLRTEFGGPDNEPHIPIVVSIRMTYENVLDKFRSLCSENLHSFQAKINLLGTKDFYYQCISLLIDISTEAFSQFRYTIAICNEHFGFYWYSAGRRPHLSLLYGNLTEEERKVALEKVSILDESISSLSFTISQLALYKINYRDTTLKSWEKIAEYNLP